MNKTVWWSSFGYPKLRNMGKVKWSCVCCVLSRFRNVWLCDPMDCSPPGSSVHRILQARVLEWVAISFSRGSSYPSNWMNPCLFFPLFFSCHLYFIFPITFISWRLITLQYLLCLLNWQAGSFPLAPPGKSDAFHIVSFPSLLPCCSSTVAKLCLTFCNPMDCSMPGSSVLHYLPEFAQIHVHWISNPIQPSHPLPPPSTFTFSVSQHQGLSPWVCFSHQVARVLELQLQHQSFRWVFGTDFL